MRSIRTRFRGPVALIRKGSGCVVGVANLADVRGPLTREDLTSSFCYHQVPTETFVVDGRLKWNVAWIFRGVEALKQPVPYEHPNGAQSWVILSESVVNAIRTLQLPAYVQPPLQRKDR
jgi:hypothetical protein